MPELRDRRWRVEVGYATNGPTATVLDVSELDIEFDVKKDLSRQPNKGTVKIHNLSAEHRAALASAAADGDVYVRLSAGYAATGPSLLLAGDVERVTTDRGETDVVTVLEAKDGSRILRTARMRQSFARGTTVEAVIRAAAGALGAGEGNLSTYAPGIALEGGERAFRSGYVCDGSAASVLDDLFRGCRMRWSVQDGALQVRPVGEPAIERAVVLSPSTGLIGSPRAEEKGKASATSLLQPGLAPGAKVALRSADFDGSYLVRETVYQGATRGTQWYAVLKLEPYG